MYIAGAGRSPLKVKQRGLPSVSKAVRRAIYKRTRLSIVYGLELERRRREAAESEKKK